MNIQDWLQSNWGMIATVMWGLCELLNQIPQVKANTVIQMFIQGIMAAIKGQVAVSPAKPQPAAVPPPAAAAP